MILTTAIIPCHTITSTDTRPACWWVSDDSQRQHNCTGMTLSQALQHVMRLEPDARRGTLEVYGGMYMREEEKKR